MVKVLAMQHQAGDRYRTVQYYRSLETYGFKFEDPHWDLKSQWTRWIERAREVDVIWIARRLLPLHKLSQLQLANPNILFDFDDALWLKSSRRQSLPSLSKEFKFKRMLEVAREVCAGNNYLASEAERIVSREKVTLIPTTVNRSWYRQREIPQTNEFTIGWIGSRSTLPYLETLKPVFESFHSLGIPWKLKIISDHFPNWPGLPLENKYWALKDEEKDLQSIDVGLNPLREDDWSRGKCALKALQYLAVGSPVLGSPVGVNRKIIKDGVNGYLPTTQEEWIDSLKNLAQNRERAHQMGLKGREMIWNHYTMEAQVENLAQLLHRAAS